MGQYDIALRHVVEQHARDLVQGLSPGLPVESASWVETQLTAMERRMDKALELRSGGLRRLLHLEIVVEPTSRLAFRMFEYATLLVISLQTAADASADVQNEPLPPVQSVALILSGRAKPWSQVAELRTSWPEPAPWSGHRFQIEPVYQRTVDELLARPGTFWLVFAPLAVDAKVESMKQVLEELRRREPRDDERADLYAAMLVVAELNTWEHNLGKELRSMMQDADFETVMQSPTFREVFEKGIEKGRRAVIEEMLQRLLMRRMQRELTPDEQAALSSRVATLDGEQASAVLDLDADALRAWLFGPDAE